MKMRWVAYSLMAGLLAGTMAWGQEPPPPPDGGPRPGRGERGEGRGWQRPGRERSAEAQIERLIQELKLDEQQTAEVRRIYKEHEEKMREIHESFRQDPEEMEQMTRLREEMRAAREADDREKIQEVRKKMQAVQEQRRAKMAPLREKLLAADAERHERLLAVMRPDQKPAFERIWQEWTQFQRPFVSLRNPRVLKEIVDKLPDLSLEQREQLEPLFREFQKAAREREDQSAEFRRLSAKLYEDVTRLLTPEQRAEVDRQLRERGELRVGGERRPDRGPPDGEPRGPGRRGGPPRGPGGPGGPDGPDGEPQGF